MRGTTVEHLLLPGDVVRAAVAVSIVVGGATFGGPAVALFLLVLGGALVPRLLGLRAVLDVCFGSCLLLAAWAALLRWYEAVPWLDLLVHAVCTGLVAAVGVLALVRSRLVAPQASGGWARAGLVVTTTAVGALGALLWELGEWAGYTYVDEEIRVGYADTVGDLAFGLLGALAAGVVIAVRRAGQGTDDVR
ncbi:hypothetical protein [Promicromonospora kroppenstedtii]|uniref:hypothetical protein n=1 Tax=Promicromonospora kroppenstedtii TaxID=440482 RepID=UPI0004B8564F|nr:hypothetical protein [Promicromonospora kroppenstedtii]